MQMVIRFTNYRNSATGEVARYVFGNLTKNVPDSRSHPPKIHHGALFYEALQENQFAQFSPTKKISQMNRSLIPIINLIVLIYDNYSVPKYM